MLSDDDLSVMRNVADASLIETVKIYRVTRTDDGYGGSTVAETLVETTVGRVESKSEELRTIGGKVTLAEKTFVYLPAETDVRPEDIVECGERFVVVDFTRRPFEVLREVEVRLEV